MRALLLLCLTFLFPAQYDSKTAPSPGNEHTSSTQPPTYTEDGRLLFPADYREWVYLTSGVDMSYSPNAMGMDHSMFDNVFVNPDAYKAFIQTGTWPDKTMLVLEVRWREAMPRLTRVATFRLRTRWAVRSTLKMNRASLVSGLSSDLRPTAHPNRCPRRRPATLAMSSTPPWTRRSCSFILLLSSWPKRKER